MYLFDAVIVLCFRAELMVKALGLLHLCLLSCTGASVTYHQAQALCHVEG